MKDTFESYVKSHLSNSTDVLKQIDWHAWFFEPGMPKQGNYNYTNPEIQSAIYLADYYTKNKEGPANKAIYKSFILDLRIIFMKRIIDNDANITEVTLRTLDKDFNVTWNETNPEVIFLWLRMMVAHKCREVDPRAKEFLSTFGRQRYIKPIFKEYARIDKPYGYKLFQELKYMYHPIARAAIEAYFK